MFELSIKSHIAAAHYLRGYEGPCKELHGHTWKIEVTLQSETLNEIGLVVDFKDVKCKLEKFLKPLDHVCLNDLEFFKVNNPSTENIAKYIFENFGREVVPLKIKQVQVWESDNASVTYYE